MIPCLYTETETAFTTNGIGKLCDALSCYVTEKRNGSYELKMGYPSFGFHAEDVVEGNIILAKPSERATAQPFRIYKITTPLTGLLEVQARHIQYQENFITVSPFSAQGSQAAMAAIKSHTTTDCPFEFWTDIDSSAVFSISAPATVRGCLGGMDGSMLDTYGGEYEWDMYTAMLHGHRGTDHGVKIVYGKNLIDFKMERSIENMITGVHPYWKHSEDGTLFELPEKVVTVEHDGPYEKISVLDCTSHFEEKPTEAQLPLYGFYHSKDELFLIQEDEAAIVREIFERFVHGEAPMDILNDMTARGVKPPAGNKWKRLQLDRMIKNEKYAGDVVLQKTYIEDHLEHKQVRNKGELPMFRVENAHASIVDRHIFEQAQKIIAMRNVAIGNSTYPYGEMLRCPHCGKPLVHGSLNNFYYDGVKIQNGGWGCYGGGGCGEYLIIQNRLDEAMITAYEDKYGEKKETVEFYWLDDTVEEIQLGEHQITIQWRDGEISVVEMDFSEERYCPSRYSDFYNDFLDRIRCGEKKNKYKYLMGLTPAAVQAG